MKTEIISKAIILCTTILISTMMSSCMEELDFKIGDNEEIDFRAYLESDVTTKGSVTNQLSERHAGVIGYYGKYITSGETKTEQFSLWSNQLNNREYIFDGDQMRVFTEEGQEKQPVKWSTLPEEATHLRVYSYLPMSIQDQIDLGGSKPTINYTIPSDIREQIDLITAYTEVSQSNREPVQLNFSHALTAILFRNGVEGKIQSISVEGVANTGTYNFETGVWSNLSKSTTDKLVDTKFEVELNSDKVIDKGAMLTSDKGGTVLMMIPQSFDKNSTAKISLKYINSNSETKTISVSLAGATWKAGDMITYTLNEKLSSTTDDYIYFDLRAGNVTIDGTKYSGKIYVKGEKDPKDVSGTNTNGKKYYIFQSTTDNFGGYNNETDFTDKKNCVVPKYNPVTYQGQPWADFITNHSGTKSVEDIIEIWDNETNITKNTAKIEREKFRNIAVVRDVGRTHTENRIDVKGDITCHITLDNIYSTYHEKPQNRTCGTITFLPSTKGKKSELTLNIVGDNRLGCIHYVSDDKNLNHKLIFEGTGSLTVGDADYKTHDKGGYYSNHFDSVIGASDNNQNCFGITINSGTIYAGSTKVENCSAIGAGGNGEGHVTINGGRVTAVATTTGTAIGGGIGYSDTGGIGHVYINGGSVYAYNYMHTNTIPSSAIGGAGSSSKAGSKGTVVITGGNVYAYSEIGTAIGGGSSNTLAGGDADITISGNATVIAQSGASTSAGIGGGSGGKNDNMNGGTAKVTISGAPIIRTGSIGGGGTKSSSGKIGSADITIEGGDIQAQFVMAAGAKSDPIFNMTDGLIRNSHTDDTEYKHIKPEGGAVYLEAGTFNMSGGEIRNCSATLGGAIYIKKDDIAQGVEQKETKFTLSGNGKISECVSNTSGGAVYLENGSAYLNGGEISGNLAKNGNGGGICIVGGNLFMQGEAHIKNNAAFGGSGGGVYVRSTTNDVTVNLHKGTIQSNSADKYGGGLCVDMGDTINDDDSSAINDSQGPKAMIEVGTDNIGPDIILNHCSLKGGGLYASGTDANITLNAGSIKQNTVSGYVDNPNVANEGGLVTLIGENVTDFVTVEYNNNFEYQNPGYSIERETQKIVTYTNTKMIAPARWFERGYYSGFTITSWNTRPDGKGTRYENNATLKGINRNITLFAQWTPSVAN